MSSVIDDQMRKLLHEFGVAMVVTRTRHGDLRSRPMVLAEVESDGTLWFLTDRNSAKMEEIDGDNHVNVTMQSSTKFVSMSGLAIQVEDRSKVACLWKEAWKVWFPRGKDDPSLALLKVHGGEGEYWDNSGTSGIKYLIEASRAYLSGRRPELENDYKIHGKTHL